MVYLVRTPPWVKLLWKHRIWEGDINRKVIYLTFDDGPNAAVTPFVLDQLKIFNAKATFFCIGKNVVEQPAVYGRIIEEGHAIGNHTYDHMNGWKTGDEQYLDNVAEAAKFIDTRLFRPPYGKLTGFQERQLRLGGRFWLKTIMWTVLSGDFDKSISKEKCLENVLLNAREGSIVVFHDSDKAKEKLVYALPEVLAYFKNKGYSFEKITSDVL